MKITFSSSSILRQFKNKIFIKQNIFNNLSFAVIMWQMVQMDHGLGISWPQMLAL